jgi:hypothetical protein
VHSNRDGQVDRRLMSRTRGRDRWRLRTRVGRGQSPESQTMTVGFMQVEQRLRTGKSLAVWKLQYLWRRFVDVENRRETVDH